MTRGKPRSKIKKLRADALVNKKELKKKVEVKTMLLDKPMTYSEFKKLDEGFKKLYIDNLRKTYHVGNVHIAEMMGTNNKTLGTYLAMRDIKVGHTGITTLTPAEKRAWNKFCKGEATTPETNTPDKVAVKSTDAKYIPEPTMMSSSSITPVNSVSIPGIDSISVKVTRDNIEPFIKIVWAIMQPGKTYSFNLVLDTEDRAE